MGVITVDHLRKTYRRVAGPAPISRVLAAYAVAAGIPALWLFRWD
jgi:hypothetical protein